MDAKRHDHQPIKEVFLIIVVNDDDEEGANSAPFFMPLTAKDAAQSKSNCKSPQLDFVLFCASKLVDA